MAIKSKSDLLRYRTFILDLDNTIYNEEDYLFQGYAVIARSLAGIAGNVTENDVFNELKNTFLIEGRARLFNKVIDKFHLDNALVSECVRILHSFTVDRKMKITPVVEMLLTELLNNNKLVYILTNGNPDQQKNKVNNIEWGEFKNQIQVFYANEFGPKPASTGVEKILLTAQSGESEAVFIGDSEADYLCAKNSGIEYFDVKELSGKGFFGSFTTV